MNRTCLFGHKKSIKILSENLQMFSFGRKKLDFSICADCGFIFQSKTVEPTEMKNYYEKSIVAFDNLYKPTSDKIKSVNRHINIIKDEMTVFPKSVLEISCLNSYVLKQFKKYGAKVIEGLEPSKIIAKGLKEKEKIRVHNTSIEKFKFKKSYDLIILTHVLEHLYDPLNVLRKCHKSQKNNQYVLLEVPLFDNIESYPNGTFFLEHLSYFSENNFLKLVELSGYKTVYISKTFESTVLPFITVIAKKNQKKNMKRNLWFNDFKSFKNLKVQDNTNNQVQNKDFKKQNDNAKKFLKINKSLWKQINKRINKFDKQKSIYIYGAGFHGSQLLYNTDIEKKFNIEGFIDSSKAKNGGYVGKYKIFNPSSNKIKPSSNIIICSNYSESAIYKSLSSFRKKGMKTYKIYN